MNKLIGHKKIDTAIFISGKGSNLKNLYKFSKLKISPINWLPIPWRMEPTLPKIMPK